MVTSPRLCLGIEEFDASFVAGLEGTVGSVDDVDSF